MVTIRLPQSAGPTGVESERYLAQPCQKYFVIKNNSGQHVVFHATASLDCIFHFNDGGGARRRCVGF